MAFHLLRDVALIMLSGLFAWFGLPLIIGTPAVPAWFLTGVVVALPISTLYAMGLIVANKVPLRVLQVLGAVFYTTGTWPLWTSIDGPGDLFPLVPPLLITLLWAWRSKDGFERTLFRGLWLYGFSMVVLMHGLMRLLEPQPFVEPTALWVSFFYLNLRLASELINP